MTDQIVDLRRYVAIFSLAQVVAIALPLALVLIWDIDLSSGVNAAGTVASAVLASTLFVKANKRAPTSAEHRRLVWLSFAACLAISLAYLGVLLIVVHAFLDASEAAAVTDMLMRIPLLIWVVVSIVIGALYWLVFWLSYGWFARFIEKTWRKQGAL